MGFSTKTLNGGVATGGGGGGGGGGPITLDVSNTEILTVTPGTLSSGTGTFTLGLSGNPLPTTSGGLGASIVNAIGDVLVGNVVGAVTSFIPLALGQKQYALTSKASAPQGVAWAPTVPYALSVSNIFTSQALTNGVNTITYAVVTIDTASGWNSSDHATYTIPETGYYVIDAQLTINTTDFNATVILQVYQNGASTGPLTYGTTPGITAAVTMNLYNVYSLTIGDTVTIVANVNTPLTLNTAVSGTTLTIFFLHP